MCSVVRVILDAILPQIVADRHLAAEAVAAEGNAHLAGIVRRRLDQNRHAQIGQPNGIGQTALLAEVRQRDDDAVDLIGMLFEERGAGLRLFVGLHRAEGGLLRRSNDHLVSLLFNRRNHLRASRCCQVARKKAPIANNQSKCHLPCHVFQPRKILYVVM